VSEGDGRAAHEDEHHAQVRVQRGDGGRV
jgi:hypothetical protein